MSPGLELFVMIICAPYVLFWYYDKSQKIADAYKKVGMLRKDDSLACLILGIFGLGIISMAIMQSNLNTIWVNESRISWWADAEGGVFKKNFRYITSYKGLFFHTKAQDPIRLPEGTELIRASSISIPD